MRSPNSPRASLTRSEEHTSELQSRLHLVCRLLLEKNYARLHRGSRPLPHHVSSPSSPATPARQPVRPGRPHAPRGEPLPFGGLGWLVFFKRRRPPPPFPLPPPAPAPEA